MATYENLSNARLPWAGKPFAELGRLAWPIAVSTLSYSVMTLVGVLFVGRLGAGALAGVGLGGTVAFSLLCFGFGLLRAVKVLVSQANGAGRPEDHRAILAAGLVASAGLAVATIAIGELAAELLTSVAATAVSGEAARTYMRIRLL